MAISEYPLFPVLPEEAQEEAIKLIEEFKVELSKAADDAIGKLYVDVMMHIESDSWTNFRLYLMNGLKHYPNNKIQGQHDFKEIRQAIYKEFRSEIIEDLNQDIQKENEELKEQNGRLKQEIDSLRHHISPIKYL